jgi:hypothetical protein
MPKKLDTNFVLFGMTVIALSAARHLYHLVLVLREIDDASPFLADTYFAWLQVFLLLSFLLAAGLIVRTRSGVVCSVLGLLGVLLGHLGWFEYTYNNLQLLAHNSFYLKHPELVPPHSFGLIGGRWWDVALLILLVALLVWEIRMLVQKVEKRAQ